MLKDAVGKVLTPDEISSMYSAFDAIGNIVILKIPENLTEKKQIIANAILQNISQARSVFAQISAVQGEYRLRNLEFLAGENTTITEYKENGCRFKVDVARTYFSPRLSTERMRIAKMVKNNEVITNMFAGVGTFSVLMAKTNSSCIVYSIDSNPAASQFCEINARLNKVSDRVIPLTGDARQLVQDHVSNKADRVLMPLPEKAKEYIDCAVSALRNHSGIVHYFAHIKAITKRMALEQAKADTIDAFKNYCHQVEQTRVVREVGPRIFQVVADVLVQ
jgi:tRNA (guanine37-N1)-methyltransferase